MLHWRGAPHSLSRNVTIRRRTRCAAEYPPYHLIIYYDRPFQRIQDYVDTCFLRPPYRNKEGQAGLCSFPQEPATRRFHDVPVLYLRPPLRQHGKRPGAYKARKIVSSEVWPCRRALHNRQAVWCHRAVLRQEAC